MKRFAVNRAILEFNRTHKPGDRIEARIGNRIAQVTVRSAAYEMSTEAVFKGDYENMHGAMLPVKSVVASEIKNYPIVEDGKVYWFKHPVMNPNTRMWRGAEVLTEGYFDPFLNDISIDFETKEACKVACDKLNKWIMEVMGLKPDTAEKVISFSMGLYKVSFDLNDCKIESEVQNG